MVYYFHEEGLIEIVAFNNKTLSLGITVQNSIKSCVGWWYTSWTHFFTVLYCNSQGPSPVIKSNNLNQTLLMEIINHLSWWSIISCVWNVDVYYCVAHVFSGKLSSNHVLETAYSVESVQFPDWFGNWSYQYNKES